MDERSAGGAPSVSVVIPVFNGEATITKLVPRVISLLRPRAEELEIVLVNDGSLDRSWAKIRELAHAHACVRGIDLVRNFGQHNALLAGVRETRHEVVVTMDDDLQHPPDEIPKLLDELANGHDVVYGTPLAEQHGLWRGLASRLTKLTLQLAMGVESARNISAFRAFRGGLRPALECSVGPFVSIDVLLAWATTRFGATPVRHESRASGKSNYSLAKLFGHALDLLTGFSVWPLRLATIVGLATALLGVLALGFVVIRYLVQGSPVPGFPFLASLLSIFAGAQLFSLGVLGEYLARLHIRSMGKPPYLVRQRTGDDASPKS